MTAEDKPNYRQERIERLLEELRYEITRGMMEGEVDECLEYRFFVPVSKSITDGVVHCRFVCLPIPAHWTAAHAGHEPRLRVVK
jgi:hypothetical protein